MNLSDIRRVTPATEAHAYFQTSGFSPKPEPVVEEVIRWLRFQNQGPALGWVINDMLEMLEETRTKVAQTINADPEEILLSENATTGINIVASGIDWKPGDNVILSSHEHPGNRVPWYNLAQRYGLEIRFARVTNDEAEFLAEFERHFDKRTRLAAISHVSRETGLRFPARAMIEIAHLHDVPILFDGAQSFGSIPIDVKALNCDFYCLSGHKYIMAPQGTGAFYVREDRIEWLKGSWLGAHRRFNTTDAFELLELLQKRNGLVGIAQVTIEVHPDLESRRRVLSSVLGLLDQIPPGPNFVLVRPVAQIRGIADLLREEVRRQVNGPVGKWNSRPLLLAHQDVRRNIERLAHGVETGHAKHVGSRAVEQFHCMASHVFGQIRFTRRIAPSDDPVIQFDPVNCHAFCVCGGATHIGCNWGDEGHLQRVVANSSDLHGSPLNWRCGKCIVPSRSTVP